MAETATQSGLAAMAANMPVRNKAIADQQRAARMLQLQQAVAAMPTTAAPTKTQTAAMGASLATASGQQDVERAKQLVTASQNLGQLGIQESKLAAEEKLGAQTEEARKETLDQTARLAAIDDKAKREIFDRQLQFSKDSADRTLFTEHQLADYARLNARTDADFKKWAQRSAQLHQRNIQTLEAVNARLTQALEQGYLDNKQKLDQNMRRELVALQQENARRIAEARARGANTAMMYQAAGGLLIAGAAVSGVGLPIALAMAAGGTGLSAYGQAEGARQAGEV